MQNFEFYADTSLVVVVIFTDSLLALTTPLVMVSTIVCEHLYDVNKVIGVLISVTENVDNCRIVNLCFGLENKAHIARRAR